MTQRCRLKARAFIGGGLRQPGFEFELADGELGPHQTVATQHERIDLANDARRLLPEHIDEPLYEVWDGAAWVKPAMQEKA